MSINKFINILWILIIINTSNIQIVLANTEENKDFYYKNHIIDKQLLHTVTVNPKKYKIINASANVINKNAAYVNQIAINYQALIAINGGFFREIDKNMYVPAGALKINNIWQGIAYNTRASIGWAPNTDLVLIDRLKTQTSITISNTKLPVTYFNPNNNLIKYQSNYLNKIIVYSSIYPNFNNLNTLDKQNFPIKEQGQTNYIYNLNNTKLNEFNLIDLESSKINIEITPQLDPDTIDLWNNVEFITSGAPILMKNNKILTDYNKEKLAHNFIYNKHSRSAICILNNGFWKFVTALNMTIPELANAMFVLQCKDAINLDGGGSSEMYLSEKMFNLEVLTTMVNPITDIIMVLPS